MGTVGCLLRFWHWEDSEAAGDS